MPHPECAGYGVVYFAEKAMRGKGDSLMGKRCVITGSGKVIDRSNQYRTNQFSVGYRIFSVGYRIVSIGYRIVSVGYRIVSVGYRNNFFLLSVKESFDLKSFDIYCRASDLSCKVYTKYTYTYIEYVLSSIPLRSRVFKHGTEQNLRRIYTCIIHRNDIAQSVSCRT